MALEFPKWAQVLKNHYCCLRIDGRNKTKRRSYYRLIEKEKLRLAELGICQECIRLICRYLATMPDKPMKTCVYPHAQISLF